MKMKRSCNDKVPERKEDALNFVSLHGVIGSEKDITKSEIRMSGVSHTNSVASHSDTESDIDADFLAEYKVLFGKFAELSHENLQLIKDKAVLKDQVNTLEMKRTDAKGESKCRVREDDNEDELQSLKRVIAEQNQVQQESGINFHQMKQLLNQELEKSQLLERQLAENYKKVRILNIGSASLDHILSIGQSPKISWGLGYKGTTSQEVDKNEGIKFVKRSIPVVSAERRDETQAKTVVPKIQDRKIVAKRMNGCLFCGKTGHTVAFCYSRRNQTERAWRMNFCYVEPRRYGHVWIAKNDMYPKFTKCVSHEHTSVSYNRMGDQYTEFEEPVRWPRRYVAGNGFHVIGAHTDSPCLKLKPVSKITKAGCLERLEWELRRRHVPKNNSQTFRRKRYRDWSMPSYHPLPVKLQDVRRVLLICSSEQFLTLVEFLGFHTIKKTTLSDTVCSKEKEKEKVGLEYSKPNAEVRSPDSQVTKQRSDFKDEKKRVKSKRQMTLGCRDDNGVSLYNRFSAIDSEEE
ncbi:Uncharacterized protein Rs2_03205 [Raphanus sativus]|nr:Uncharacterized protein Rs2_03205 [Raphanus sativus]